MKNTIVYEITYGTAHWVILDNDWIVNNGEFVGKLKLPLEATIKLIEDAKILFFTPKNELDEV